MKISKQTMEKKVRYVIGRLSRNQDLTLAEIQRRLRARFGHGMGYARLVEVVRSIHLSAS